MTPEQLLAHHDQARPWPADADPAPSGLDEAYRLQLAVRALREARGERPRGFKVGFTNRGIWPRYQVFAPIWGTVWEGGLHACEGQAQVPLTGTCEPRIEPECVFGFQHAPPAAPGLEDLRACIDWIAPGLEVVQSHRPAWRFTAADTVADGGLHAALVVGRRCPVAQAGDPTSLAERLASASVILSCDGVEVERGRGANVLDGPVQALLHFVRELQACPGAPGLKAGDVVTTGTWTDAWPIQSGQVWTASFDAPLSALQVRFID